MVRAKESWTSLKATNDSDVDESIRVRLEKFNEVAVPCLTE